MSDTINENIYMSEDEIQKRNRHIFYAFRRCNQLKAIGLTDTTDGVDEIKALRAYDSHKRLYARSELTNILNGVGVIPVDLDILIDYTQYKVGQRPEDVPEEQKLFSYYRKNSDGTRLYEGMRFDDLLAEQHPDGLYAEPEQPKLGFFGWLRHKMSFLFGEPQEYKEYERKKEVVLNRKKAMIREKYGYDKLKINEDLLDEEKADAYIHTGDTKVAEAKQEKESFISNEIREPVVSEIPGQQKQMKEEVNEKSDEKVIFEVPDEKNYEQQKKEVVEQLKKKIIQQPKEEIKPQPVKIEMPKMDIKKTKEEAAREMLKSYAQDDSKLRRFGAALLLAVIETGNKKSPERQFLIDAVGGQKIRIDANRKKLENLEQNKDKMQPEDYTKQKDALEKQSEKSAFAVNELVDYANRAYPEEEPKDAVAWTTGWLNKAMTNKVKTDLYDLHQKELADRKLDAGAMKQIN